MKESIGLICVTIMLCFATELTPARVGASHFDGSDGPALERSELDERLHERLLNELYLGYIECIRNRADDQTCYERWAWECEISFGEAYCEELEARIFPEPLPGDESC